MSGATLDSATALSWQDATRGYRNRTANTCLVQLQALRILLLILTMTVRWRTPLLALFASIFVFSSQSALAEHSFENAAIVRTVDLGGSSVHVTTTYAIKALENGAQKYAIALGEKEAAVTSFMEAKIKGQSEPLGLHARPLHPTG